MENKSLQCTVYYTADFFFKVVIIRQCKTLKNYQIKHNKMFHFHVVEVSVLHYYTCCKS